MRVFVAAALCAAALLASAAPPDSRQIENKEAELEKVRKAMEELNSNLTHLRGRSEVVCFLLCGFVCVVVVFFCLLCVFVFFWCVLVVVFVCLLLVFCCF